MCTLGLFLALGTGCSSSANSPSASSTGGAGGGADSGVQSNEPVGTFIVRLIAAVVNSDPSLSNPAHTQFQGVVRDGPVNSNVIWSVDLADGDCKLLKSRSPLCDPGCDTNAVCVQDGVCKTNPTAHSVGEVSVSGLKLSDNTTAFTVTPSTTFNYVPTVTLQYPPAEEGATVRLTSTGGDYQPLELSALGVAPLMFNGTAAYPMQLDQPLTLDWIPKGAAGDSTMEIQVNINHHGGTAARVVCNTADDGTLVIAAPLVTRLMNIGYSGYPQVDFVRKSVGKAKIAPGYVELQIVSGESRNVSIPGLTSCNTNTDCTNGQTCLTTKQCG